MRGPLELWLRNVPSASVKRHCVYSVFTFLFWLSGHIQYICWGRLKNLKYSVTSLPQLWLKHCRKDEVNIKIFHLQFPFQSGDDPAELRNVSICHQAAVVGPALCSSVLIGRLVVGQFCFLILCSTVRLQALSQVHHPASEGSEQSVGGAGVPLESAPLWQDVSVSQALDDAQDLVPGSRRVHQFVGAAQRGQRLLYRLLLAGAQDHRWPTVLLCSTAGPRHRTDVDTAAGHTPVLLSPPPRNDEMIVSGENVQQKQKKKTKKAKLWVFLESWCKNLRDNVEQKYRNRKFV